MKILIVDDSKAMRMIVQRNLRQAGFEDAQVIEAADGQEGLDKVLQESPDVVVSDWNMPVMNGIEFLGAMRERGIGTTFGFVTSEATPDMRDSAMAAGADFYLVKPFSADKFQAVIGSFA